MKSLDPINISLTGTKLIEASAGTGKTYAITSIYVRLVVERQLEVENILLVTFTEAATKELRGRVRQRLRDALTAYESGEGDDFLVGLVQKHSQEGYDLKKCCQRLRLAIQSIDLAAIYTIHGFCARILRDCAFESGSLFDLELIDDDSDLLGQIIDDYWRINSGNWHNILLGYLFEKKVNADTLFLELQAPIRASLSGEVVDLPAAIEPSSFAPPLSQLSAIWQRQKETITELLANPVLSAAKDAYSPANRLKWLGEIDHYFASGLGSMIPLKAFERLSQGSLLRLTKKTKKGATPEHDFFLLAEELVVSLEEAYFGIIRELLKYCLKEMPLRKNTLGLLSFDDLLFGVRDSLAEPETGKIFAAKIRKKYPAVLIDEFQDTDRVQYDIFHGVYGNRDNFLFLLGDPKQAIYRFRGADVYAYLQAVKVAGQEVYSLETNWRSEPGLITAVNLLFGREFGVQSFLLPEIGYVPIEVPKRDAPKLCIEADDYAPLSFLLFPEQGNRGDAKKIVAEDLAGRICRLIALGQGGQAEYRSKAKGVGQALVPGDIAVLVRNHRDGEIVRSALYRAGVRAVVHSRHNVFHSVEARELHIVLAAILQPGQGQKLKAALATTFFGWSAARLLALDEDETLGEEILGRFLAYQKTWLVKGLAVMAQGLFCREEVFPRLAGGAQGERRLTNIRHLVEILHEKGHEANLGMAAMLAWFHQQRHEGRDCQETELRLESDESLVKIVTIHKSKGLEYSVVCCPFLWDSSFLMPKKRNYVPWHDEDGRGHLDLGTSEMSERRFLEEMETMAEELRLLYVALTRARSRCLVHWGRVMSRKRLVTASSALHYLFHRPELTTIATGIVKVLDKEAKDLVDTFFAPLFRMAEISPEAVKVDWMAQIQGAIIRPAKKPVLENVPEFTGSLEPGWRIKSFSALQFHSKKVQAKSEHSLAEYHESEQVLNEGVKTFFDFPRGAQAGSCLHHILERLDFSRRNSPESAALVRDSLIAFGIAEEWQPVVSQALGDILQTPLTLNQADFTLSSIAPGKRLTELEFYYSLPALASEELLAVFRGAGSVVGSDAAENKLPGTAAVAGYMKGFIDLIFEWEGRYYILDYKSNFLGRSREQYDQERLAAEMVKTGYDLQYHIYLVALQRYLGSRLASYDYDTHIGGVYYLFLRGMSPGTGPEYGVYYERPDRQVIEGIDQYLSNACTRDIIR